MNTNLKQKNGSSCNFYNFSLLVPYHSNFLVVQICIGGGGGGGGEREGLISFFERQGWAISFHKAINDQSCKLQNSVRQNYLFRVCILTFLTSNLEFFVCSSVPWNSKKCLLLFGNNSVKVRILFDMSSK